MDPLRIAESTIVALSTPPGAGAIAVIRVSGADAIKKTALFFSAKNGKALDTFPSHKAIFGDFKVAHQLIDEVLLTLFRAPHSYTGEEVVEISCHGSPFIQQQILQALLSEKIYMAQPGEFTLRAYLNKKLDLSQAEAVADLIASENEAAHQMALQQMRGGFSEAIESLRQKLIEFTALIELELDFGEEDVEFANRPELQNLLEDLSQRLTLLVESFAFGNVIKDGVGVVIAGKPNAGKSSLLNALLNEDRAIVSNIPGTTRDTIEDNIVIEGIKFRFIDTAGLRETSDSIEAIGVQKAKDKVAQATVLLYLFDRTDSTVEALVLAIKSLYRQGLIVLLVENKIDQFDGKVDEKFNAELHAQLKKEVAQFISLSTLQPDSVQALKKSLVAEVEKLKNNSSVIVSNMRHFEALKAALLSICDVQEGLKSYLSGDLLSIHLKETIAHIGSITGKIDVDQDILGTIFGKFCIGK